ncbi:pyruvate kinase [Candidatus Saccharibacteria bacterium]|nr:pyruvate kinase [Candidatus Saccharibacteria bacterium]
MKNVTQKAPNVPISDFKRTKILATVGPSTHTYKSVLELIKSGANGIRLNFSHGSNPERVEQIKWIRKASKEYGKPIAILQDLQGPKIRLGDFEGVIPVEKGQSLRLSIHADYERSGIIPIQYDLSSKVRRGHRILMYDGKVRTTVTSVKDKIIHVQVENDGVLLKRKGMNLPDTDFSGDIITAKDKEDVAFGSTLDIDYVGLSFVHSAEDIRQLKRMLKNLGSDAKVIAKIETVAALENIESIIEESDAIMVARGDLAVETSPEVVPLEQRRIVGLCRAYAKPVIIATQMLATMTESSEPTRAEVSDVATAAIIGTDCVMLSDETASGRYPIEAVKMMKKIVTYTEQHSPVDAVFRMQHEAHGRQEAITSAVITLASEVNATAIVAETKSGATAIQLAARRSDDPIIAVTSQERVANQLAIVYGIKSYVRPDSKMAATKLTNWLEKSKVLKKGDVVVTASGQYPGVVGTTDTIKVRVL